MTVPPDSPPRGGWPAVLAVAAATFLVVTSEMLPVGLLTSIGPDLGASAGTAGPLTVAFPEPLDHALIHRLLWVTDAKGQKVAGTVKVTDEETRWHFTAGRPWQAGRYRLVADTTLEDLAGNKIGRPFEVDVFRPIQQKVEAKTVEVPFEVR